MERQCAWGFHRMDGVGNRERKVDTIRTQLRSEHSDRLLRLLQYLVSPRAQTCDSGQWVAHRAVLCRLYLTLRKLHKVSFFHDKKTEPGITWLTCPRLPEQSTYHQSDVMAETIISQREKVSLGLLFQRLQHMIQGSRGEVGVTIGYTAHLISQEGQPERDNWPEFQNASGGNMPNGQVSFQQTLLPKIPHFPVAPT